MLAALPPATCVQLQPPLLLAQLSPTGWGLGVRLA
jgi:hypothetical protein